MATQENRTRPTNTAKFAKQTGRSWEDWCSWLDGIGGADLTHAEIARRVFDRGGISGWWSQAVTVAYEQHIGRRVPGQIAEGQYATSASKTVAGTIDDVLARFTAYMAPHTGLNGVAIVRGPDISRTPTRGSWRCGLADRGSVTVGIDQKAAGKAIVGVKHDRIASADAIEVWRAFWKGLLKDFC